MVRCCAVSVHLCLQGLGLVFVAVYQKTLSLLYVDELLQQVKDAFIEEYTPGSHAYSQFSDKFAKVLRDCESRADAARRAAAQPKMLATTNKAASGKVGAQQGKLNNGKLAPQRGSSSDADSDEANSSGAVSAAAGASGSAEHSAGSDEEEAAANGDSAADEAGFDMSKLKAVSRKVLGGPPGRRHAAAAARRAADAEKDKPKLAAQKSKKVCWSY